MHTLRAGKSDTRQAGVVLIVALLLLTLMALVTFSTYNGTIIEERMAGNANNRNVAFQTAELTLRSVEMRIDPKWGDANKPCAAFPFGLTKGYYNLTTTPPQQAILDFSSTTWSAQANPDPSAPNNDNNKLPGWEKPTGIDEVRYTVELTGKGGWPKPNTFYYRITVRTVGDAGNTVVILESTYACG